MVFLNLRNIYNLMLLFLFLFYNNFYFFLVLLYNFGLLFGLFLRSFFNLIFFLYLFIDDKIITNKYTFWLLYLVGNSLLFFNLLLFATVVFRLFLIRLDN